MLKLPVVLAIDRAGLVGEDGETHHGIYDVGFLRHAPGMQILCPASMQECADMIRWAVKQTDGPVAVRYPRGGNKGYADSVWNGNIRQTVCMHHSGIDFAIVTYGTMVNNALKAAQILQDSGIEAAVLRLTQIAPLDYDTLLTYIGDIKRVYVAEEVAGNCSIRESIACELQKRGLKIRVDGIDLGNQYIQHGAVDKLYDHYGLSGEKIAKAIMEVDRFED